jgi:hypothetical protein
MQQARELAANVSALAPLGERVEAVTIDVQVRSIVEGVSNVQTPVTGRMPVPRRQWAERRWAGPNAVRPYKPMPTSRSALQRLTGRYDLGYTASAHDPARGPARESHRVHRISTLPLRLSAPEGTCLS